MRAWAADKGSLLDVDGIGRRLEFALRGGETQIRVDDFGDASCMFVRRSNLDDALRLELAGHFTVTAPAAGGWLACPTGTHPFAYWSPALPRCRKLGSHGHILAERDAELSSVRIAADGIQATVEPVAGHTVDCAVWRLPAILAHELHSAHTLEQQKYFLWGSHTSFGRPAHLYRHVVFGAVYEDRFSWPHKRRICSENDAHALFVLLTGLARSTGKRVYHLLRRQIALSVVARQAPDGAFRHGEWTDSMESHYRLHCSAMHLMVDALAERPDAGLAEALGRAASFLAHQAVPVGFGQWLLHDELEHSVAQLKQGPFNWVPSAVFGKSESNMLVLNSHLDATIALDRNAQVTRDQQHAPLVQAARESTRAVLGLRSAEPLYRMLFWLIGLTFLPAAEAAALPLWKRALKRLAWKYLISACPTSRRAGRGW